MDKDLIDIINEVVFEADQQKVDESMLGIAAAASIGSLGIAASMAARPTINAIKDKLMNIRLHKAFTKPAPGAEVMHIGSNRLGTYKGRVGDKHEIEWNDGTTSQHELTYEHDDGFIQTRRGLHHTLSVKS